MSSLSILDGVVDLYINQFTSSLQDGSEFAQGIEEIVSLTGGSTQGNLFNITLTTIIEEVMPYFQTFAVGIALLFCFISIIEVASQDKLTPEALIKKLGSFALSFGVIMYSKEICYGIINLGGWMARAIAGIDLSSVWTDILGGASATDTDKLSYDDKVIVLKTLMKVGLFGVDQGGFFGFVKDISNLGTALKLLMWSLWMKIPTLILSIANAVVFFMALSRGLELGVRTIFMPIPMAMMADDGWRGAGGRYIRRYMAVASQGAAIVAAVVMVRVFISAQYVSMLNLVLRNTMIATYISKDGTAKNYISQGIPIMDPSGCVNSQYQKDMVECAKNIILNSENAKTVGTADAVGGVFAAVAGKIFIPFSLLSPATSVWTAATSNVDVLTALNGELTKGLWVTVAVVFAGLGIVSKSLQIMNDVWGA